MSEQMTIEQAQEIDSSSMWATVVSELDFRIKAEEQKLRHCQLDQLREIQLKIRFLEEIKMLPKDVKERQQ